VDTARRHLPNTNTCLGELSRHMKQPPATQHCVQGIKAGARLFDTTLASLSVASSARAHTFVQACMHAQKGGKDRSPSSPEHPYRSARLDYSRGCLQEPCWGRWDQNSKGRASLDQLDALPPRPISQRKMERNAGNRTENAKIRAIVCDLDQGTIRKFVAATNV